VNRTRRGDRRGKGAGAGDVLFHFSRDYYLSNSLLGSFVNEAPVRGSGNAKYITVPVCTTGTNMREAQSSCEPYDKGEQRPVSAKILIVTTADIRQGQEILVGTYGTTYDRKSYDDGSSSSETDVKSGEKESSKLSKNYRQKRSRK